MIDASGVPSRVLLVGGTSEIGVAVLDRLGRGRSLDVVLAGRPSPRLEATVGRLRGAGHRVRTVDLDAEQPDGHPAAMEEAWADGDVDVAVVAVGLLGDQEQAWTDHAAAVRLATVDGTAAVSVGVLLARHMRAQGHGAVVLLSTVAAMRPRRSNFPYGAAKAHADAFYTGLREAVRADGVHVLVVRPGFVRSRMTDGLDPAPLATDPATVADAVAVALLRRRETVVVPRRLGPVMAVLRAMPARVFRRLPV